MQAQIAATLRHLKEALTHLHDAALIIEGIDKATAQAIAELVKATRHQIKQIEFANDGR